MRYEKFLRPLPQLFTVAFVLIVMLSDKLEAKPDVGTQFAESAPRILHVLRERNIQTVGVLKFSACIGDGDFPDSLGNLNIRLAEKLELSLILAQSAEESKRDQQIGIVRDASKIANSIEDASHVTDRGRELLFSKEYSLAWQFRGKTSVIPDGLIIGVAQIENDLQSMNIELVLLDRSDFQFRPLATLNVRTNLEDLIDSGESFTTRGLFDNGSIQENSSTIELVAKQAAEIRKERLSTREPQALSSHPLVTSSNAPISFEVWYDKQPQPFEFREGVAFVKEPSEGQDVIFVVRRKQADGQRYGVLIRVNGENTLYRQRIPDTKAALWILEADSSAFSVRGFQTDSGTREAFRVLSDTESKQREVDYGRDVGMISLVVYREGQRQPGFLSDKEEVIAAQSQVTLPNESPKTLGKLTQRLFAQFNNSGGTRGLLGSGQSENATVDTTTFNRNPMPVMATSIRYYDPSK